MGITQKDIKCGLALKSSRKRYSTSSSAGEIGNEIDDADFFSDNFEVET